MKFKAKLNLKFYIISILLLGFVVLGWYGLYFLNVNEILTEDNTPMDSQTKMLFTMAIGAIVLSWTFTFFTLIRQVLFGYAFVIDENGIHTTATAINVLAFIFVVPIRTIPFSAIEKISEDNGILILHINKNEIDMIPFLRVFARKRYHLFSGFTVEKQDVIKVELEKYIDEAKEHIDFLVKNVGDTYCARCAVKNDFSLEYQQEINHESIEINPVKPKNNKSVVFSILLVIIMIILLGFVSNFNVSTIYKSDFNMSGIEYLHEYDKNGNILTFKIKSQKFYYSEEEQKRAEDYKYFEQYLGLNNYKGCNVTLIENNMNEIHAKLPNIISFSVVIDYRKTDNQIFEVMSEVELTEKEYLSKHKDKSYTIRRYKKYLGVATIFDEVIDDM